MDQVKAAAKSLLGSLTRRAKPVAFAVNHLLSLLVAGLAGSAEYRSIDTISNHFLRSTQTNRGRALEVSEIKYLKQFGSLATRRSIIVPTLDAAGGSSRELMRLSFLTSLVFRRNLKDGSIPGLRLCANVECYFGCRQAVRGARNLLKPGGAFLGTVAGISPSVATMLNGGAIIGGFTPQGSPVSLDGTSGMRSRLWNTGTSLPRLRCCRSSRWKACLPPNLLAPVDPDYPVVMGFLARFTRRKNLSRGVANG